MNIDKETKSRIEEIIPAYEPCPCDCAEKYEGPNGISFYVIECQCGNPEDREYVARWCERTDIAEKWDKLLNEIKNPPESGRKLEGSDNA